MLLLSRKSGGVENVSRIKPVEKLEGNDKRMVPCLTHGGRIAAIMVIFYT